MFCGGPTNESRTAATPLGATGPRRALRSASRFTARSRHETDPAQSQAPRPGAVRLTRMPWSGAHANRTSSDWGARRPQPTHVRTGARARSGVAGRLLVAHGGLLATLLLGFPSGPIRGLCVAFKAGKLPGSLTDARYFNVKVMKGQGAAAA